MGERRRIVWRAALWQWRRSTSSLLRVRSVLFNRRAWCLSRRTATVESAKETSKPPKHRQPSSSRPANRNAVLSTRARTSSSSTEPPAVEAPTDLFSTKTEQHLPGLPFHTRDAAPASDIAPAPATTLPSAVLELQTQLNDLRTTTTATETRLHSDLEALKTRKKDEEAARVELKARGKASEEVKRAAEHEHAEAEKRLHTVRAGRQTALNAVHHADTELNRLDKRFADLTAKRERSATNRLEREETLRSEVEQRQLDLKDAEVKAKALANKVEGLETSIEQRKLALYARLMQPQMMRHPPGFAPHLPSGPWGPDRITPSYVPPVPQNRSPSLGLDFSHVNMPSVQTSSFLEHRIQHLSDHHAPANSAFSPFGPSTATSIPLGGTASRGIPLPFFSPPPMDDGDPLMTAAMDDGEAARRHMRESTPLSPMTPNHRTLIPSTLFDMLEDDGDLPASPILARHSQPTNNFPWPAPAPTQALPPAIGGMRHPLALNPDAKAFSFNRPLPRQQVSPVIEGEKEVEAAAAGWTGFSPFD